MIFGEWLLLGLFCGLVGLVVLNGVLFVFERAREKRALQEKGTCFSCRHLSGKRLGVGAVEYPYFRMCVNRKSPWYLHVASREFWKRLGKGCGFYKDGFYVEM
jgi:hypothetical protein